MVKSFFQRRDDIVGDGFGYKDTITLIQDIVTDLQVNNGFTIPSGGDGGTTGGIWILEADTADPLSSTQPWRIAIDEVSSTIWWGTDIQINEAGLFVGGPNNFIASGSVGVNLLTDTNLIGAQSPSAGTFVYEYILSVSDRGFALSVFPNGKQNDAYFTRSIVIQRPTNPVTGDIKQDNKAPVFAVFSGVVTENAINSRLESLLNGSKPGVTGNDQVPGFNFSVVRDLDNPTASSAIAMNVVSTTLLYTFDFEWFQPALLDNFNHVIKFPFGMALSIRHIYLDEMDMMGLVNGATFAFEQEANIDLYTPTDSRVYIAGPGHIGESAVIIASGTGSQPPSTGKQTDHWARLAILKDGDTILGTI